MSWTAPITGPELCAFVEAICGVHGPENGETPNSLAAYHHLSAILGTGKLPVRVLPSVHAEFRRQGYRDLREYLHSIVEAIDEYVPETATLT